MLTLIMPTQKGNNTPASYANANTLPIINTVNAICPTAAVPFVFTDEGKGEGNIEFPHGYPYRLGDIDAGLSGLVCVWHKWCSSFHLMDDNGGDVSVSVLSGWHVTSGLDAATPIPVIRVWVFQG